MIAALTLLATLAACSDSVSPRAERVFYRGDGEASWGTVCALNRRGFLGFGKRGYISVAHVTENGTPLVGPTDAVTAADPLSDWSFLGIDPMLLNAQDYPAMHTGMAVEIHGYPARDRDGEVVPGVAYLDDPEPPFWWLELRDSDAGIAAEGVIGGFSGSCVFDGEGALVAVVHANGFSSIGGTTNTFAKVVPVRTAILQAQNRAALPVAEPAAPTAPLYPMLDPPPAMPDRMPAPLPDTAPDLAVVAPPAYVEVAPTYLDTPSAQAAPPVYRDMMPPVMDTAPTSTVVAPPVYRDVAPALPRTAPASATAAPPVYHRIIPTPRGAYRPRGIDCADCI